MSEPNISDASFCPQIHIAGGDVYVWRVAITEPVHNAFGSQTARNAVVIRLEDTDGAAGWGELWANFPAPTAEYRARLAAAVVLPALIGQEVENIPRFICKLEAQFRLLAIQSAEPGPFAAICGAVDAALWDLAGVKAGMPVCRLLNPACEKTSVPAYASGINPAGVAETIARCREDGFSAFKVKVGFGLERDRVTLRQAYACLGTGESLMADANQGWILQEAERMVADFRDIGLEWLEEPIPADEPASAWESLRAGMPMPLAGGENLRGAAEFESAGRWLDVIQPDIGKWGGISRSYTIGRQAVAAGKRYCPHWLAGGIGLLGSAHVLAAVGGTGRLEIDANPNRLRTAVLTEAVTVRDGQFYLPEEPGLGIVPDLAAIAGDLIWQAQV